MPHAVNDEALDTIFRSARTFRHWLDKPVSPALLMAIYDLLRWGPTTANTNPARLVFVVTKDAKERLKPHLDTNNIHKTMSAPATAILAYDLDFHRYVARLNPHAADAKDWFSDPKHIEETAFRNGSLQGAYFIIAARALGLDCGPMSGFDKAKVDAAFLSEKGWKSNFLVNLGHGDPSLLHERSPRFEFDEACLLL